MNSFHKWSEVLGSSLTLNRQDSHASIITTASKQVPDKSLELSLHSHWALPTERGPHAHIFCLASKFDTLTRSPELHNDRFNKQMRTAQTSYVRP